MLDDADIASGRVRDEVVSFLTMTPEKAAVVIDAAPGSGKSYSLLQIAKRLIDHDESVRVAIVTQTNSQANDLAESFIDEHDSSGDITYRFASDRVDRPIGYKGQWQTQSRGIKRAFGSVIIGTSSKWTGLAASVKDPQIFNYVLVDEAYQMTWSVFVQLLNLGSKFLLIGDKGQIPPVVTVDASRWAVSDVAPHIAAPAVLKDRLSSSDHYREFTLKHCRRLPHESIRYISEFYLDSNGENVLPVAEPGQRKLTPVRSSGTTDLAWKAIEKAASGEPVLLTLGDETTGDPVEADRELAQTIRDLVKGLIGQNVVFADNPKHQVPLTVADIAICATKRAMNAIIEDELQTISEVKDADHSSVKSVLVDTPERLQGLQRKIMIAVHPLSNTLDPSEFDLDTGRLCVMASRHQVALIVVSRAHVKKTLELSLPNSGQAPGRPDAVGRGHALHRSFIEKFYLDGDKSRVITQN